MLTSLALIFLVGLAMAAICQQIRLPRIIGMLLTGIVLGPFVLDLLDSSILSISGDLRKMALIIILLKAGLSLNLGDLKKVGRPAFLMAFLPASFEILAYFLFAPALLGITPIEAAVMGAVLGAVSPAVVVPRMVQLMESGYGTNKSIPQMILAGASCDDIFVIVVFTTFLGMTQGSGARISDFMNIPVSILSGVLLGALTGWLLALFFETAYAHRHCVRNSMKVIIVLGISFVLVAIEDLLEGTHLLRYRLPSESYRTGCHRLGSSVSWTSLRKNHPLRSRTGHPDYGAIRSHRNGCHFQAIPIKRILTVLSYAHLKQQPLHIVQQLSHFLRLKMIIYLAPALLNSD